MSPSAGQRLSVYYALLFGGIGAASPFAALWMDHAGIEVSMIGVIVAAPSMAMLLTTLALGRWADGLNDRRQAIIVGNWIILIVQLILFFTVDQWIVLLVWLVMGIVMYAKLPITDASALSLTNRIGSDYARIRVFGSLGFVLMLTLAGYLYEQLGIGVFIIVMLILNALRLVAAYQLPSLPRDQTPSKVGDLSITAPADSSLYRPGILLTLLSAAIINASHAMVNTYGILLWTQQGLSESLASQAVGLGVVVEIALMWWFKSLTRNVSARACLMVAATCGILRWSILASEPSLLMIFAAQALHGLTFGVMFLASASFISRRVPDASAARGQSLLAIMTTACMATATFGSGQLFEAWAGSLYWIMALMCGLSILCIAGSYRFKL